MPFLTRPPCAGRGRSGGAPCAPRIGAGRRDGSRAPAARAGARRTRPSAPAGASRRRAPPGRRSRAPSRCSQSVNRQAAIRSAIVGERLLEPVRRLPELELAHAGRVEQQPAAVERDELAVRSSCAGPRRRTRARRPSASSSRAGEAVHERRLADAGRAEQGDGLAAPRGTGRAPRTPSPVTALVTCTSTPSATISTLGRGARGRDAGRPSSGRPPAARRSPRPWSGSARCARTFRSLSERRDEEDGVDVRRDDLLARAVDAGPSLRENFVRRGRTAWMVAVPSSRRSAATQSPTAGWSTVSDAW